MSTISRGAPSKEWLNIWRGISEDGFQRKRRFWKISWSFCAKEMGRRHARVRESKGLSRPRKIKFYPAYLVFFFLGCQYFEGKDYDLNIFLFFTISSQGIRSSSYSINGYIFNNWGSHDFEFTNVNIFSIINRILHFRRIILFLQSDLKD